MSMNGKRDAFTLGDFRACAKAAGLKRGRDKAIFEEVCAAVSQWTKFSAAAGVPESRSEQIKRSFIIAGAAAACSTGE